MRFNTALAALMDQLNYIQKLTPEELGRFTLESYILMLAPMAPFVAEEFWRELGHQNSVHLESWPKFDEALTRDATIVIPVQVNGKVRDRLEVEAGATQDAVCEMALRSAAVTRHLDGKAPKKIIYVPGKLVSIVA
jgi:leucyl-tRNA synthetase